VGAIDEIERLRVLIDIWMFLKMQTQEIQLGGFQTAGLFHFNFSK